VKPQMNAFKHLLALSMILLFVCILDMTFGIVYAFYAPGVTPPMYDEDSPIKWGREKIVKTSDITQPDGVIVKIELVLGGENNPYILLRKDDYTVVTDKETMFVCWARQGSDGNLESTGYPIHLYDPEKLRLEKNIRMSKEQAEKKRRYIDKTSRSDSCSNTKSNIIEIFPSSCPSKGTIESIIIYKNFDSAVVTFPIDDYSDNFTKLSAYYYDTSSVGDDGNRPALFKRYTPCYVEIYSLTPY